MLTTDVAKSGYNVHMWCGSRKVALGTVVYIDQLLCCDMLCECGCVV